MSMSSLKSVMASAGDAVAITPHDTNEYRDGADLKALYIGGAGDVAVTMFGDSDDEGATPGAVVTFVGVAAGTILPIRALIVMLTNTTATNIVGLQQ